jgi:hypothetical protein
MAEITPARKNLLEEQTQYRAAVSESLLTTMGASVNFINEFQTMERSFQLNGSYTLGVGQQGADQVIPILFDMEIVGISIWNGSTGSSGQSIFDIHRITGGDTDAGSIFSTRPQMDSTSIDNTCATYDYANAESVNLPTGFTHGILNTTNFNRGDCLRLDIDDGMPGASNAGVYLFIRPR